MVVVDAVLSVDQNITVIDEPRIRRVVVISKGGVHTADNVVAELALVLCGHIGHAGGRPVVYIGDVLLDVVISGDDRDVGIGRVALEYVQDLSAGTGRVVENDLGLGSRARNQCPSLVRNDIVVTVGAEGSCAVDSVVPCGSRYGAHADYHHQGHHEGYYFCDVCFHFFLPFKEISI